MEKLGKCADVAEELIRHLSVLNDVAKKTYDYHRKNERAALAELKAGYNIECSGKGSNEEKTYNKEMTKLMFRQGMLEDSTDPPQFR